MFLKLDVKEKMETSKDENERSYKRGRIKAKFVGYFYQSIGSTCL